jgi:pyruvate kinase
MLSEETAVGRYPVEAVRMMTRIAEDAESGFPYASWTQRWGSKIKKTLPQAVAFSACSLAENIRAASLITFTHSGSTARLVSKYRPSCCILAPTPLLSTYHRLALVWGVVPLLSEDLKTTDQMIARVFQAVLKSGLAKRGQKVVITAGVPIGVPGTTNLIKAEVLK